MGLQFSRLGDIADVVDSLHKTPSYATDGHPMVRVVDVKYGTLNLKDTRKVDDTVFTEFSRRFKPKIDDTIITRVGSYGISALVKDTHFCLGQNTAAICPKINKRYFYLALNSPVVRQQIEHSTVGSTQKTLSLKAINNLEIPRLGDLAEQSIACFLGALDDKIELNRRMNETLEEMARALFRDWFVDFGPTRRQMEGTTDPAAIMGHAFPPEKAATLAPLFPAKLGDDGLPDGWSWATVGALTEKVTKGTTPRKADLSNATSNESVPFYRVVNLSKGGQLLENSVQQVPLDVHLGALKRSVLRADDILYSIAGTIGRVCKMEQRDVPANLNQALAIVRPDKTKTTPNYLLLALRSTTFQEELHSNIVQAVQANLSLGMISNAPMLSLPVRELKQVMEPIDLLLAKADANEQEIQTLAALRDLLLPKLMSGEIRLKDAEALV